MTFLVSSLVKTGRAAAVALAFGAVFAAMPAMADSAPSFNFGIHIPGGGDVHMGLGGPSHGPRSFHPRPVCLSDDDIANELEDAGWRRVDVGDDIGRGRVEVTARWGRSWYDMIVNRCTGAVYNVHPSGDFGPGPGGPGFRPHGPGQYDQAPGFSLQFGN